MHSIEDWVSLLLPPHMCSRDWTQASDLAATSFTCWVESSYWPKKTRLKVSLKVHRTSGKLGGGLSIWNVPTGKTPFHRCSWRDLWWSSFMLSHCLLFQEAVHCLLRWHWAAMLLGSVLRMEKTGPLVWANLFPGCLQSWLLECCRQWKVCKIKPEEL